MSGKIVAGVIQHPDSSDPNLVLNDDGTVDLFGGDGLGNVVGLESSTDNALVRFDGTTGKVVQNSGITVDDSGNVSSNLTVSKASAVIQATATGGTAASVRVSGDAGTLRDFAFYTGANSRWFFRCDNVAESGSDAGSNFVITQKLDSGASPSYYAFTINRATGKATLGSVGATAGLELGSSGPRVMSGTGSPEGVVTAPVGSTWRDTNATTGAIKWLKASGSGSSGWVVEYGDTGWRNLAAESLLNSWAVGSSVFAVRRVGSNVTVRFVLNGTSATGSDVYVLPTGFRPDADAQWYVPNTGNSAGRRGYIQSNGTLTISLVAATYCSTYTFSTVQAWPSSLPGTAL